MENLNDNYDSLLNRDLIDGKLEGEHPGECSLCPFDNPNIAVKEITYKRVYAGLEKTFKELVCQECLDNDPEYFVGKIIVSIKTL